MSCRRPALWRSSTASSDVGDMEGMGPWNEPMRTVHKKVARRATVVMLDPCLSRGLRIPQMVNPC